MKKIFLILLTLLAFTACKPNPSKPSDQVIDLRIKNSEGNVYRSVETEVFESTELSFTRQPLNTNQNFGCITETMIDEMVKFFDDPNGIKICITVPEVASKKLDVINVIYIDENKNWSTNQQLNWEKVHYWDNEIMGINSYDYVEWIFPLVIPNKEIEFAMQFFFNNDDGSQFSFSVIYNGVPKHGIGKVDNLPKNWVSAKYVKINDNIITVNNVIPIEEVKEEIDTEGNLQEITTVTKIAQIWGTNENSYWNNQGLIGTYRETVTDLDQSLVFEIPVDEVSKINGSNYQNLYVQFFYEFHLDEAEGTSFKTNEFLTTITQNTAFK